MDRVFMSTYLNLRCASSSDILEVGKSDAVRILINKC